MKYLGKILLLGMAFLTAGTLWAQDNGSETSGVTRRGDRNRRNAQTDPSANVTERMQLSMQTTPISDADMEWMRVIYRQLDLSKPKNAPLYFPDEPIDGQENLFRIIMRLLANGQLTAYEYLDGRELFTDKYQLKVRDMLDRFHVLYTEGRGSTEKHPKFEIDDSDVPATEVLNYYIIERWEFDRLSNRMRTRIEAICPVLSRAGDFGGEALKYPMFWIKMDDLRPFLKPQNIFTSDDNNLATCNYDDYFTMGMYEGDIYKTRNLRNLSLMQMYPEPEALARAQDSIQRRLTGFEDKLWVPSLDELRAAREAREEAEAAAEVDEDNDSTAVDVEKPKAKTTRSARTNRGNKNTADRKPQKKETKPKSRAPKATKTQNTKPAAARSVRNRRK